MRVLACGREFVLIMRRRAGERGGREGEKNNSALKAETSLSNKTNKGILSFSKRNKEAPPKNFIIQNGLQRIAYIITLNKMVKHFSRKLLHPREESVKQRN